MFVLLSWHLTEQALAASGKILVDRDVDRGFSMAGQDLGGSEEKSGDRRCALFGIECLRWRLLDDRSDNAILISQIIGKVGNVSNPAMEVW